MGAVQLFTTGISKSGGVSFSGPPRFNMDVPTAAPKVSKAAAAKPTIKTQAVGPFVLSSGSWIIITKCGADEFRRIAAKFRPYQFPEILPIPYAG